MSGTNDKNYISWVGEVGLRVTPEAFPLRPDLVGGNYDDILKFSSCRNTKVVRFTIPGGREDCIDCVRGEDYTFMDLHLKPIKTGITLKGAITGWMLDNCLIEHGSGPDIEVGQFDNYWKPGRPPTSRGIISMCGTPNDPVRLMLWDADTPALVDSHVKIIRVPKWVWFPYFVTRYFQVRIQGLKTT